MVIEIEELPLEALQAEDVTAHHHVMTSEGMPEDVGHLPRRIQPTALVGTMRSGNSH